MYYIISLKHTNKSDEYMTLWRSNDCGYCYEQSIAGLYADTEVYDGYHDGDNNLPVEVETLNKFFIGDENKYIPNVKIVWDALGIESTKKGLIKKSKHKSELNEVIERNGRDNIGLNSERTKLDSNHIEDVLSKHWANVNKNEGGISFGYGVLQNLFMNRDHNFIKNEFSVLAPDYCIMKMTNRDRFVVATAIQWLGTNVGFNWLRESLKDAGYDIIKHK